MARAAGAPRAKKWVFTLNNYTAEHVAHLSTLFPLVCSYLVFGREIAPETGTRHLQGFAHFVDRKSLLQAVASLGQGSHCEVARGSSLQASIYCKKEADYEEFGVLSDFRETYGLARTEGLPEGGRCIPDRSRLD